MTSRDRHPDREHAAGRRRTSLLSLLCVVAVAAGALLAGCTRSDGDATPSGTTGPGSDTAGGDTAEVPPAWYVSGGETFEDASGRAWQSDASIASGGTTSLRDTEVDGTANPELYQHSRKGVTGYRVPLPQPGVYSVVLFLVADEGTRPGDDVFDVTAGGDSEEQVDVAGRVGTSRASHVVLRAAVADPYLDISFQTRSGSPDVSALSVHHVPGASLEPEVVFSDDFTGSAGTRPSSWQATIGAGWTGADSLETFTDRPENASLDGNGNLALTARAEAYTGLDGVQRPYTSARLTTRESFQFEYGRVESRIRMPAGEGILPALWALGNNELVVRWPAAGEIDIVEVVPPARDVLGTLHGPDGSVAGYVEQRWYPADTSLAADFHLYSIDWYPDVIQFGFDGVVYGTVARVDLPDSLRWVFDHPFYLLLSMSVGGWVGAPSSSAQFPATMSVDSVRVVR